MTHAEQIRTALTGGQTSIGGWMQIPDDGVATIMGAAGFDWVALDLEHGRFSEAQLPSLFRAVAARGTVALARVGQVTAYAIKAALDGGASGVILPMIETAQMLREAIAWANYPPRGTRGVGYAAANLFGKELQRDLDGTGPLVVAQIEHAKAVACIDALLETPGLDAVMLGPYDLSASLGVTGEFDHPEFRRAMTTVAAACRRHGIASGVHIVLPEPERLRAAVAEGHRFIAYGTDAVFLWKSAVRPDIA
ncbi:MAG: aldolase/citrate lyase family protein [Rhizomicrobium sp.]